MRRIIVFILTILFASPLAALADVRHFEGEVLYNGDVLPIRVHIDTEDASASTLDIPQLWYAEEPLLALVTEEGGFALTFPFGLGDFTLENDGDQWSGASGEAAITLEEGVAPPYTKEDVSFGGVSPHVPGTLYIPDGEGPFPAVILVGGASGAGRGDWSYRSKADYYARMGIAALVYDRRPHGEPFPDGTLPDFTTHADDLAAAREMLVARADIGSNAIGLHGASQGVWPLIISQAEYGGFAFLIMTGVPAVTPADQQTDLLIYGMRDDGLPEDVIADAVAYQRLYFSVAHTGIGWEALEAAIAAGEGTDWLQYVDQPRSIEDLDWWRRHLAYEPRDHLMSINAPILAISGQNDWLTPPIENLPKIEYYAGLAGNEHVRTMVIEGADHRLERDPYTDDEGQWHWFEIASEAREAIPSFLREEVGLILAD